MEPKQLKLVSRQNQQFHQTFSHCHQKTLLLQEQKATMVEMKMKMKTKRKMVGQSLSNREQGSEAGFALSVTQKILIIK
jgi:hypothetical protein